MAFYLDRLGQGQDGGWHALSTSNDWQFWLFSVIPRTLNARVRRHLKSNLKHILVGLEMKAGLVMPHGARSHAADYLFEPYFQMLIFEFNVGVFSICEGLGAALHLASVDSDGAAGPRVAPADWVAALCDRFDPGGGLGLEQKVAAVKTVRDKLHQDRVALRPDIDWHDFGYPAFINAVEALQILLSDNIDRVPRTTNLIELPPEEEEDEEP
jgi:hypothetical protein